MRIKDCIVVRKPYIGEITYNGQTALNGTGTFNLEGGLVFEDDGETPFDIQSGSTTTQATLNNFIYEDPKVSSTLPTYEDGYRISDVEFTWKPIHPVLASYNLITVGCFPGLSVEKAVQNNLIFAEGANLSILERLPEIGELGDGPGGVTDTIKCVQNAVAKFRKGVNLDTAAIFQAEVETCLNNLYKKVSDLYCGTLVEGVSAYKTTFSIDTDVQFTTREITATVVLKDAGGTVISNNIPESCLSEAGDSDLSKKLKAIVTLGKASDFIYDRDNGVFTSQITSGSSGPGELRARVRDGETCV